MSVGVLRPANPHTNPSQPQWSADDRWRWPRCVGTRASDIAVPVVKMFVIIYLVLATLTRVPILMLKFTVSLTGMVVMVVTGKAEVLHTLETECDTLREEAPKLKLEVERLRNEKRELQEKLSDTLADYSTVISEFDEYKHRADRERETTGQLLDELGKELGELRQYKIDVERNHALRESHGELPVRYHALQTEVVRLKEENKDLHDTNEDLSAQLLTNCLEEGRGLVNKKDNSLAAELDHLTKEELMAKLRNQTDINYRLQAYVDRILLRIMEMNPTLLEV